MTGFINKKMWIKTVLLLGLLQGLTACFPVYKTIRPNVHIQVLDAQQQPVSNADLYLRTILRPGLLRQDIEHRQSDATGQIQLKRQSKWMLNVTFLHGVSYYHWNICVMKAGYQSQWIELNHSRFQEKILLQPLETTQTVDHPQCEQMQQRFQDFTM